ncbi:hypothetical protein FBU30_005918 [Linnemannia zychae]|nr:hypothetical protein FBU30_005918 [Linnemannia zychae]
MSSDATSISALAIYPTSTQVPAFKNTHNVRELEMNWPELVYYCHCVILHEEQHSLQIDTSRPFSFSPLVQPIVPMPPMTLLTRLHISLHQDPNFVSCPYLLTPTLDPAIAQKQVCDILRYNQMLEDVTLTNLALVDERDTALLALSLHNLTHLTRLALRIFIDYNKITLKSTLFFCMPSSLQTLQITTRYYDSEEGAYIINEYLNGSSKMQLTQEIDSKDSDDNISKVKDIVKSAMPLTRLNELWMWDMSMDAATTNTVCQFMKHCPNVRSLRLPLLSVDLDIDPIIKAILTSCAGIRNIAFDASDAICQIEYNIPIFPNSDLPFVVLEALPAEQVDGFYCYDSSFILNENVAKAIFQRHSFTLSTLVLQNCVSLEGKAVQVILTTCSGLINLEVGHFHKVDSLYESHERDLSIIEAIEQPWVCTKLKSLALAINMIDGGIFFFGGPYYRRSAPIELSCQEQTFFNQLETFYIQIGGLTELEELNLHTMWGSRPNLQGSGRLRRTYGSFPGMLSLGNKTTGRPGFLHCLNQLKKLRVLRGSVYADTDETLVTMGMPEAIWMLENWPSLEQAEFFPSGTEPTQPFRWMMAQRMNGLPLRLSYP